MKTLLCFIACSLLYMPCIHSQARGSIKTSQEVITIKAATGKQPDGSNPSFPFDKAFTVLVIGANTQAIRHVYVYKTKLQGGRFNLYPDKTIPNVSSIPDFEAAVYTSNDTMQLSIPPVKPSMDFNFAVVRGFTKGNLKRAYELNEAVFANNNAVANAKFRELRDSAEDQVFNLNFFNYADVAAYTVFFNTTLLTTYQALHNPGNMQYTPFITDDEANDMQRYLYDEGMVMNESFRITEINRDVYATQLYDGTRSIKFTVGSAATNAVNYAERIANLQVSEDYFKKLYDSLNTVYTATAAATVLTLRNRVHDVIETLVTNRQFFENRLVEINQAMAGNENLSEVEVLVGSTIAKDLKTLGGNLFTMDVGFTTITSLDNRGRAVFLPKPYYGLNIYFRPVDKNTRRKSFPVSYPTTGNPDYTIASVNNVWTHLCLTIGLTFGSISNTKFDYMYNNAVLLIGPGYRVGRFIKFNAGAAFLKRTSKNPLISQKTFVGGAFVSMSADIDVIQGIRDFTNYIFK